MNNRIKQLAEDAGFGPVWFEKAKPGFPALPKEGIVDNFAKSIALESINYIEQEKERLLEYQKTIYNSDFIADTDLLIEKCDDLILGLKEHFGFDINS